MREILSTQRVIQWLSEAGLGDWAARIGDQLESELFDKPHGDIQRWKQALASLPQPNFAHYDLSSAAVTLGRESDLTPAEQAQLLTGLQGLLPWRKGPFDLFGQFIDTEWHSDWKWERVAPHLDDLKGRRVLDVGCGNGYYAWRLLGEGADSVLGLDPTLLFFMQDQAIRQLMEGNAQIREIARRFLLLPLGIEALPAELHHFDLVMSMGVLYHRRSPLDHLLELRNALRPGGQLLLETLVVEGEEGYSLLPPGRYAKMRNVWFLPSVATLESWLARLGLQNVRTVDVCPTSTREQRATDWMRFESLVDFLDPLDSSKTIEGHPAPVRAVISAQAP
ncbi:MAG: tRNA 5-methoxyuridine(34)/uridine 5-oxyacetic acid(34) synthase CmoB [Gammaproteobacteria bacterium]